MISASSLTRPGCCDAGCRAALWSPRAAAAPYRINAARRQGDESLARMFPAAVAVVDAGLGLVLRLTSYIGANPVQRHEFRDVSTDVGDFRVNIPGDLPTVEESPPLRT